MTPSSLRHPGPALALWMALALGLPLALGAAPSPATGKTQDRPETLPFSLLGPASPNSDRGGLAPSVFAGAAQETVYFGGTFWNPDSARWEALRDSAWTFDSGVGSSLVPPGGSNYPGVNPFKEPGLHQTMEGWVGFDGTYSELTYFRRIAADDPRWSDPDAQGTCVGAGAGLGGLASFWAGVFADEARAKCYHSGQGYGNYWNLCVGRTFSWSGGAVALSFKYRNDTEPGFDFTNAICDTSGVGVGNAVVTSYDGSVAGTANLSLIPGVTLPTTGPKTVVIKFCATSDGAYSDEDGSYATTCGAFAFDDVILSGGITHSADFETGDDGWALLPPPPGPGGDWSNLVSLSELPPPLAPCACSLRDTVLVFEDPAVNGHGLFQDNLAASPWIDLRGHGLQTPGKLIRTDVYADLPLLNYIFAQFNMQWYPALCAETGKLITSPWTSNSFVYHFGGVPICLTVGGPLGSSMDFSAFVPENAEQLRIGVGVLSYCRFFGNCTGTTNSTPWFDRVALGVYGVPGAPYLAARAIDLPQDSFPENGGVWVTNTGRVDCNTLKGSTRPDPYTSLGDTLVVQGRGGSEAVEVRVQFAVRPGPGIDATRFQGWLTRHRFEETKNDLDWYSARMDTAESGELGPQPGTWMTAYHEEDPNFAGTDRDKDPADLDPRGKMTRLKNDIFPDDLLTPGSRLMLFYEIHYLGSPIWYLLPDTTRGNAYEMEVLPSSMEADRTHNAVLFVDHFDGVGNDRLLERALTEALPGTSSNFEHTTWDRWDVRAPTSLQSSFGRPLSTQYGANSFQIWNYKAIYWDSGTLTNGCLTQADASVLRYWLRNSYYSDAHGLYLAGDDLAYSMTYLSGSYARELLEEQAEVTLRCSSFRSANCPTGSPVDPASCVILDDVRGARTVTARRAVDHQGQGNGCPELRKFDLLLANKVDPHSTSMPEERYEGSVKAGTYSSISNVYEHFSSWDSGVRYRTVADGISVHNRRDPDNCESAVGETPTAMVERLREVLGWLALADTSISGFDDLPDRGFRTALAPVVPNPVRPGTPARISFTLARAGRARITVYDLSGRVVRDVFSGEANEGENESPWDLRDNRGQPVAAGVYFYRLEAGEQAQTRKLVVSPGR